MGNDTADTPWQSNEDGANRSGGSHPSLLRLDQQVCFPLYAASRLIVQAYAPHLVHLGLTYPQYLVMLVLWEDNGSSVKEIGARLYLDSGTLTPILKKLERLGYIERRRSLEDDRAVLNYVTESGSSLIPKALQMVERLAEDLGLNVDDLMQIRENARRLIQRFCHMGDRRYPLNLDDARSLAAPTHLKSGSEHSGQSARDF